jgi:DNA polymerase-3 subunit alpha
MTDEVAITKPAILDSIPWSNLEQLNREKELVGIYLSAHPLDNYKVEIDNFCNATLAELNDLQKLKGKDVSFGGIVTAVRSGMTKNSKPYGGFTVEDYSGSFEIMFFGNDYMDYKNYCTVGYSLFLKGKVQERSWGKEEEKPLEFKVNSIQMLGDLREKLLKSIAIKIPVSEISDNLIQGLMSKIEESKGNAMLKFLVFDPEKKIHIQMFSRSHRVEVTNELLEYLDNHPLFEYKLE